MHPFAQFLVERDLVPDSAARALTGEGRFVREPIGMIAVSHALIGIGQIDQILDRQRETQGRFGQIAIELGCLTPEQVQTLVGIQEFRAAADIAEALALARMLSAEDSIRYLAAFVLKDTEVLAMMGGQ